MIFGPENAQSSSQIGGFGHFWSIWTKMTKNEKSTPELETQFKFLPKTWIEPLPKWAKIAHFCPEQRIGYFLRK